MPMFQEFGQLCGVISPPMAKLQKMLEQRDEVPDELVMFHVKLLRKMKKSVTIDKWEKALVKFSSTYSSSDSWELDRYIQLNTYNY